MAVEIVRSSRPETAVASWSRFLAARSVWFVALGAILLTLQAGKEFQKLRAPELVSLPLAPASFTADGDVSCGRVVDGLPPWRRRWDGEPPRAWIAESTTGAVLAPPLLSESGLSANRRGVLWEEQDCRLTIDRSTCADLGESLVLVCTVWRSRGPFYLISGLALACGLTAILIGQCQRVFRTARRRRGQAIWREVRVTTFVLLSLGMGLAFFPGLPVSRNSSDTLNINSFAAATSRPEAFLYDPLLGDARNFAWYTPSYVSFVRLLGDSGFHYDTSRAALAVLSTLAALFGYDRLFRVASRSKAFGFAAAVGLWFLSADYPPNEVWEPTHVLPRTVYAALLPWVLLCALAVRRRPERWPLAAIASAVLFYIHPVSSPALTGAILTGLVCGAPGAWWRRLAWGGLAAAAAVAVMVPYTLTYAAKYSGTVVDDPAMMSQAVQFARERYAAGFLDPALFAQQVATMFALTPRYWIGLIAAGWLALYRSERRTVRCLGGLALGWAIVTFILPTLDIIIAARLGRLPFQVDLFRNLRYLDILLLGVWAVTIREGHGLLRVATRRLRQRTWDIVPYWLRDRDQLRLAGLCCVILCFAPTGLLSLRKLTLTAVENVAVLQGRPNPAVAADWELLRVLETIRGTEEVVHGPLFLRQAHVPLAFSQKDLGALAYANPRQLVLARQAIVAAEKNLDWPVSLPRLQRAAGLLDADLFVLDRADVGPGLARSDAVLFQNDRYLLVQARQPARVAAGARRSDAARSIPRITTGPAPRSAQEVLPR